MALLALPVHGAHETLGPLAGVLPSNSTDRVWSYGFVENGWLARNHRTENNRSARHFAIPNFLLRENPRPYTYTVKVRVLGDERALHPEVGAMAGLLMDIGVSDKYWAVAVTHDGLIKIGNIQPRANKASFDIVYRDKTKAGAETTLLIIEFKDKAIAYVNGRALITFDNPPEGSIGIFIMGGGDFHFRDFSMAGLKGEVVWQPKRYGHEVRPRVRR